MDCVAPQGRIIEATDRAWDRLCIWVQVLVACALLLAQPAWAQTQTETFDTPGVSGSFTVPDGVTRITLTARGASGGNRSGSVGGGGATVSGVFDVSPGDVIYYVTGEKGANGGSFDAGGGGSTGIFINSTLVMVAGGGGGADNTGGVAIGGRATLAGGGSGSGSGCSAIPGGTGGNGGPGGGLIPAGCNGGTNGGSGGGGINSAGFVGGGDAGGGGAADLNPLDGLTVALGGAAGPVNGDISPGGARGGNGFTGGGGSQARESGGGGGYSGGAGGNPSSKPGGGGSFLDASRLSGTITAGPNATDTGNGSVVVTYPLPDLVTVKTLASGNATPSEGDVVTFTITVSNNGAPFAAATNVDVTDLIPAGLTPTANNGNVTQGNYDAGTGLWDIGDLSNSSSATLTIEGTVDPGEGGNTISNTIAAASGDQPDPSTTGDDLNESVVVDPNADLVTVKTLNSGDATPSVGDTVSFLITVTNEGAARATNVSLADGLPAGLTATLNNGTVSQGSYDSGSSVWTIGQLEDGASATLLLEGTVDSGQGAASITNTTSAATGDQPDPTTTGDDLTESVTVNDEIDAVDDNAGTVNGADGGDDILDAFANDTINGVPVTLTDIDASVTSPATPASPGANVPVLDPATGLVDVPAGTPAGVYTIGYEICEDGNLTNCDSATITVTVTAAPIDAADDNAGTIDGLGGGDDVINAFDNDTLNGVAVDPADIDATVTSPGTPASPGANVPVLDPATGLVDVPAGTPAGVYTIGYRICEELNPTNCDDATMTVTVTAAAIDAADDNAGAVDGLGGGDDVINAFDNDTLGGVAVDPVDIDATVTSPATPTSPGANVPVLDPATGLVDVPAGTPAGVYTIGYQICETLNPTNCDDATITVTVTAAAIDAADDNAGTVDGLGGGDDVINVFDNDTLGGVAVDPADIDATVTSPATPASPGANVPVLDPATGLVDVPAGTSAGVYTIGYQICETLNPTNCDDATITVTVTAPAIDAADDNAGTVDGLGGGDDVINAFDNDTLGGIAVDPADIDATVTSPATPASPGANVPVLDPATGLVDVPANTPAGVYTIGYRICETLNPTNCDDATITVTVTAAPINAADDNAGTVDGLGGGDDVINAFDNDTLNGVAIDLADIDATVTSQATPASPGANVPVLDPATGLMDVPAGTPAGVYTIGYQICETLNPTNCDTATITVTVTAPAINAADDNAGTVDGLGGGDDVINAFDNDTLGGMAVDPADIDATVTSPATPASPGANVPVLDPATGLVDVPANTPAGVYTIGYQICETLNPSNCDDATITVTVTAAPIDAANDNAGTVDGLGGGDDVINTFDNDTLNGMAVDPADIDATVTAPATPASPGANVPVLDPATGLVDVPAGTPAGVYTIGYQICETLNPANCDNAVVTFTVIAPAINAADDNAGTVEGLGGGDDITNAFDNDTLGGMAFAPADVDATVTSPATPASPGATVPVLDPATGLVDVPAGTPAGNYTIGYRICDAINPTSCDDAVITVTVTAAPIDAADDNSGVVDGAAGGTDVVNAFDNDTLGGMMVDPANIDATVTSPATPVNPGEPVPVLDPATGQVDVPAGTPAGTYTIGYEICETLNPANCDTATITVTVTVAAVAIDAADDNAGVVDGTTGGDDVINIFDNDTLNSAPVAATDVNTTVTSPATPASPGASVPVLDPATGFVDVPAGTPAGVYTIGYEICERLNPTNCDSAVVTVTVNAGPIDAADDNAGTVEGLGGGDDVINAYNNDTLGGMPFAVSDIDATVTSPATPAAPGANVPVLDPATGLVDVPANTPAGVYTIGYEICESLNPANCDSAVITVTVTAAPINAADDNAGTVDGQSGADDVINAFDNDTLGGVAVNPADIDATVTSPATPASPGANVPVLDPATGLVDVPAGTPAGTYTIGYEICETLNPANCDSAVITVTVTAAPIDAADDNAGTVEGLGGADDIINAFDNDTLNGMPFAPADVNATVTAPATPASPGANVPVLDPATGLVDVPANTPAGVYTIGYQICEALNPANCDNALITVTVTAAPINAADDNAGTVDGLGGADDVINAFDNDTLGGVAVNLVDIDATVTSPATPASPGASVPVLDPATGLVDVPAGTPAGSYTIGYQICETLNPANCDDAVITVNVTASPINAADDDAGTIEGLGGADDIINAFDNDTLGGMPFAPADVNASVTSPATPATPGAPVPLLDPATGLVDVPAGTPAGTYTIGYEICEALNPANCDSAIITVTVTAAPINAGDDDAGSVGGISGADDVINVFDNDTLGGVAVDPADIDASVHSPATPATPGAPVPVLDPATGLVDVPAGTPVGAYTIGYQICETLNPANCDDAVVTITVTAAPIDAADDDAGTIDGNAGGDDVINAFDNDTLNGMPFAPADVNATVTAPASPASPGANVPVLDPATGLVDVPAGTPAGTYTIGYDICEALNPSNCDTAVITVTVTAAPIDAADDNAGSVDGLGGGDDVINVFENDTLGGAPVDPAEIDATVTSPATPVTPGAPVPVLDPATGLVDVPAGTPAGTYTISYEICETLNPANCDTASVTIEVTEAPISASDDSTAPIDGRSGGDDVINAFDNDTLGGQPVDPAAIDATVTSPATPATPGAPVPVLDPATGLVSVPAGTPAGTYTIGYDICETLNPTNCASATITVTVSAAPISASDDDAGTVDGSVGGDDLINAFANDTLNGDPVALDEKDARVTDPATPTTPGAPVPVLDPETGLVSVPAGTPAGSYTIGYEICEALNPTNCDTAVISVTVTATPIEAADDTAEPVSADIGSDNAGNVFDNDTLGGQPVDPSDVTLTILAPASDPGVAIDPATGIISVSPDAPAGTYVIEYQICEVLNPDNCASAFVTVVVEEPIGAIAGTVYDDLDGDRVVDGDEPRRAGWIVEVLLDGDVVATTTTDTNGDYAVEGLFSGDGYEVRFREPTTGVLFGRVTDLELAPGESLADVDQPIDPSGVIYDSVARTPISGVTVRLVGPSGNPLPGTCFVDPDQQGQVTTISGEYRFDILPGANPQCPLGETRYRIEIDTPPTYSFVSTVILPQDSALDPTGQASPVRVSPSFGAPQGPDPVYYLQFDLEAGDPDVIQNHIPLDPFVERAPLTVTKSSIKRTANVGDLVPYEITVRNNDAAQRAGVDIVDILPPGMKYVEDSARCDGQPLEPELSSNNRLLTWRNQTIAGNATVRYSLVLVVGAGVTDGEKINTALAREALSGNDISNRGTAVVRIVPSAVFDCAEVIGKVYEDADGDGYQDEGEPGVPGVRLATVNGELITTDEYGRYHIACAAVPNARIGSNFVLKVDPRTLPLDWEVTTDNPRSIRLTRGKMGELNFGVAPPEQPGRNEGEE